MKQNSVLLRQSFPEKNRRVLSCTIIIFIFVAMACGIEATPCFAGNTSGQEYGDPVYRENSFQSSNNVDHAALFAGVAADNTLHIIHAQDLYGCIQDGLLSDMSDIEGKQYWGAYNLNNRTLSFSNRRNIMTTAIELRDENLWWEWYDCLNPWVFTTGTIKPENICNIRCDGLVEYCYEYRDFDVWGKNGSHYDVSNSKYCGEHNDLYYGGSGNANTELAPVVQRGAKDGTSTHMTRSAITDLPTYDIEKSQIGNTVYVTITATDQSGIHYIKYKKGSDGSYTSSPVQPQHPDDASYSIEVPVTSSTWLYYYAKDNGWNYPQYAESYWVNVGSAPPAPINVSATDGTYTDKVRITWSASSGATSYEVYRATSSGGTKSKIGTPSGTSYDDTSASVGTTYYYWVMAKNSYGTSGYSSYNTGYRKSCTYSISPTSKNFSSSGGSSVSVTTQSGCSWSAGSNASWISITSGSSGSGNGTVSYSVSSNSSASQRTGTMTIAGKTFTVTQDGITCTYSISPTSQVL